VVDGCVNSFNEQKWHITEKQKPFVYRLFRVSDRMSKKVDEQFTTPQTLMVDGCVDILGVCIQTDITNNRKLEFQLMNDGYLIIEVDRNDETVLLMDIGAMDLIRQFKKHWISSHCPFLWVRLSENYIETVENQGTLWGGLTHTMNESWKKGLPTLNVEYYAKPSKTATIQRTIAGRY